MNGDPPSLIARSFRAFSIKSVLPKSGNPLVKARRGDVHDGEARLGSLMMMILSKVIECARERTAAEGPHVGGAPDAG